MLKKVIPRRGADGSSPGALFARVGFKGGGGGPELTLVLTAANGGSEPNPKVIGYLRSYLQQGERPKSTSASQQEKLRFVVGAAKSEEPTTEL